MVSNLKERLDQIEAIAFPTVPGVSVGFDYEESVCSICQETYETCDHIAGIPYMGEFCAREIRNMTMHEVSLVKDPANKHARITQITDDSGVRRNLLSWEPVSSSGRKSEGSK